jgi:hypothetical protein
VRPAILPAPRLSVALSGLWLCRAAACRLVDVGVEFPRALLVARCLGPLALRAPRVDPRSLTVLRRLDPALLQPAIASAPSADYHEGEEDCAEDNQDDHKRAHMTSIVVLCRYPDDRVALP